MNITRGKVLKYALLPQIVPRLVSFFTSGFANISLCMAQAFTATRLLPVTHPYLSPENKGKFGIRHVLGEARRHLVYDRRHLDQIIMYYMMILGLFLMLGQFVILGGVAYSSVAHASGAATPGFTSNYGTSFTDYFVTDAPESDIAFHLLDRIFGIPGLYGSCVDPAIPCTNETFMGVDPATGAPIATSTGPFPTPMQLGLHKFLHFYNIGILAVAIIIFLYLVTTVVAETAQSGTPFGRRFNHAMTPLRMIMAIALLMPLGHGLNAAQHITLHVAKWGSGLATNSWILFNDRIKAGTGGYTLSGGTPASLVMMPVAPELTSFLEYIMVAHTCVYTTKWSDGEDVKLYQITGDTAQAAPADFFTALTNAGNDNIILRFGVQDNKYAGEHDASVRPACGEIIIQIKSADTKSGAGSSAPAALKTQEEYYKIILELFNGTGAASAMKTDGKDLAAAEMPDVPVADKTMRSIASLNNQYVMSTYARPYNQKLKDVIPVARNDQIGDAGWYEDLTDLGWAGASIWYNKIAQMNGAFVASVHNIPTVARWPDVMERVIEYKRQNDVSYTPPERFNPIIAGEKKISFKKPDDLNAALALYKAQRLWINTTPPSSGSFFTDTIKSVLGLEGLYKMQDNVDVHPLAQLTGIGRSMVESAVRNLGISLGTGLIGKIMGNGAIGDIAEGVGKMSGGLAQIGLTLGFVLAYIVPFLPFVYFLFAVGTWIKVLFEAIIGVPLWAIAHIRIDGEGLPGPSGMNGYYMLLEIFLRPVLIIFGLIGSIMFFAVMTQTLHGLWPQVTANLTGHGTLTAGSTAMTYARDAVDTFFYLIIYTIVVYIIGLSCFKLVDLVPNNIMRWIGSGADIFSEYSQDTVTELLGQAWQGSQILSSSIGGIFNRNK